MLRFMLQEGVAEILISFITLVGGDGERPVRGSAESEDLKKSYRCDTGGATPRGGGGTEGGTAVVLARRESLALMTCTPAF